MREGNSDKEKFRSNIGRKVRRPFRIVVKKYLRGWLGFRKSYVIFRVGHCKCLRRIMGGVKKGQKHAYIIFEWSPMSYGIRIWTSGNHNSGYRTSVFFSRSPRGSVVKL